MTDFDLHSFEPAQQFYQIEQAVMLQGVPMMSLEETFKNSFGEDRWYSTTKIPLRDPDSAIVGLAGIGRDITERKQFESINQEQGSIIEMIARNAPLQEILTRIILFIESQLVGITGSVLILDPGTLCLHHGAAPKLPEGFWRAIDGVKIGPAVGSCGTAAFSKQAVVTSDITKDKRWADFAASAALFGLRSCWSTPIISHDDEVLGTFAMYSADVRHPNLKELALSEFSTRIASIAIERQRSQDLLYRAAHYDSLTGLPNRTLMEALIDNAIKKVSDVNSLCVAFVDLDNFKLVNDDLGHVAGDKLLQTVAFRMRHVVASSGQIIRLGGDEFVLILSSTSFNAAAEMLEQIRSAIAQPIIIGGRNISVSCSMGLARYPIDGETAITLIANADIAMYSGKNSGRNTLTRYDMSMSVDRSERSYLRHQLQQALDRDEFFLVYQPQIDLETGYIFGVEALLRWNSPELGVVSPDRFISVAEESGLIVPIGHWVLQTACAQNKHWQSRGLPHITIAVNVSARQFNDDRWSSSVSEALRVSGLDPRYLELELTESMVMGNVEAAATAMGRLRNAGVQMSIDDFGTGYSSLSALRRFPVTRLKLDKSFVHELDGRQDDRTIAAAIISMGRKLGMRVIAEGVETEAQRDILRDNGCDEAQGYLFGRPTSPTDIEALLRKQDASAGHMGQRIRGDEPDARDLPSPTNELERFD